MIKRAIVISKETYDILRLISVKQDKFLYELIDECIEFLKEKYKDENVSS